MSEALAGDFVTDQQNFKKTFIVRYKKFLTKCFCSSIRIGKKVTGFKYKPVWSKQYFCVDTKDLMIKRYKPVEQAQINRPRFCGPNSIRVVVLIDRHNLLEIIGNVNKNLGILLHTEKCIVL